MTGTGPSTDEGAHAAATAGIGRGAKPDKEEEAAPGIGNISSG